MNASSVGVHATVATRIQGATTSTAYELCPRYPLPTLDLSASIKSRCLQHRAEQVFNALLRLPVIKPAGIIGMVCYLLMFVVPVGAGRVLAALSTLLYVPNVVAAFGLLRYEVVRLMLGTFDFWFSLLLSLATFAVLGLVMGDVRGLAMLGAWFGTVNNILIDANIRIVKVWVVFNIIAAAFHSATWIIVSAELVVHLEHHALLRYHDRELSSKELATSGLATVTALVVRNVYRKRHALGKAADIAVIECVSYRTDLKYIAQGSPARQHGWQFPADASATVGAVAVTHQEAPELEHVKTMRCFGIAAAVVTVLSITLIAYSSDSVDSGVLQLLQWSEVTAFVLSAMYCGVCALHYHRAVFVALCSLFDFVFLSAQITIVHASLVNYLRGRRGGCWGAATSWLWIHWVLTLDALTPAMRTKLGLHKRFVLAVMIAYAGASATLVWELVPANNLSAMYRPVLWSGRLFGHEWELRLIPLFCNCLGTAIALCLRLLWRLIKNDFDVLLVLNGAVTYENYLVKQRAKARRQRAVAPPPTTSDSGGHDGGHSGASPSRSKRARGK